MHLYRNIAQERSTGSSAHTRAATPVVFIVDHDPAVRESLEALIRPQGWHPQAFACAGEFLDHPRVAGACCLLLDVDLPGISGLELQQRISDRTDMPLIFITEDADVGTIVSAMKAGALEYLMKPFRAETLLATISFALDRSAATLGRESATRAVRESYVSLSSREREVLDLVASGWLNKQIAAALGLSEITVKVHRSKMMRKMKAASLPDLVRKVETLGMKSAPMPNVSFSRSFESYAGARRALFPAHAGT
jgi:FixJ family two-component response regulator